MNDLPQEDFVNGRPEPTIKNNAPARTEAHNRDNHQSASVIDAYDGMEISRAVDPKTSRTLLPHEIGPDSIVYVRGKGSVTLQQAQQLGWVKGSFSQGQAAAPDQQQQQEQPEAETPEAHPDLQMEAFDGGGEADLLHDSYVENTSPGDQMAAIHQIVNEGQLSESTFVSLASQMGLQREEAEAKASQIMDAYGKQARAAMTEVAPFVDPEEVAAWAWENHSSKFADAQKRHATLRTTAGYRDISQTYLEAMDEIKPDAILNATFPNGGRAFKDHSGRIMIEVPNAGTFSWKSAVKAGYIGKSK